MGKLELSPNKGGLKHLDKGSVIAFGSGKKSPDNWNWYLDTVIVVKDFIDYDISNAYEKLQNRVPEAFLDVTVRPLIDNLTTQGNCTPRSDSMFRLYFGAPPDDLIFGMYSFSPAIPAGDNLGFERPFIRLPSKYFNPKSIMAPKGAGGNGGKFNCDELRCLWKDTVKQVQSTLLV